MGNTKQLKASVKLDISDVERKINRLNDKIKSLNKAVNIISSANFEQKFEKATKQANKMNSALGEGDKSAQKLAASLEKAKRRAYEQWWQETLAERERQRSLKTLGEGDKIAQQLARSTQQRARAEKEAMYAAMFEKLEWQKAHPILTKLSNGWEKIKQKIRNLLSSSSRLSSVHNTIGTKLGNIKSKVKDWWSTQKSIHSTIKSTSSSLNSVWQKVKAIAAAYVGMETVKLGINTSDTITSAQNRLNNIEGGNPELTAKSMDKMYAAAQRSRSAYSDMLGNVSKTMALAGDSFQGNVDNAIRFQEIMSKAYTIGGASSTEASTSMYQLVQALGSGILQGDELRSVREGAPIAYKKIEEFAQGVFKTEDSLKDLASQGVITSDIIVAAIMDAEEDINKSFDNTRMTFAQAWDNIKNMTMKAFEPALQKLNELLNSDAGQAVIVGIGNALVMLGNVLGWVIDLFASFFNWCAENWSWLKYVVIGVIAALIAALIYYVAISIVKAAVAIAVWLAEYWTIVAVILIIGALVAAIIWLANTTVSGCEFIIIALLMVAAAILLIGIITGSTTMIVIGIVIAAVAAIVALMAYCGEEVMGIIYTAGAFIYNLVVGLLNGCLQLVSRAVEPFIGIIEFILNAANGGFNSFGDAVANLIGQVISWFLSLGKVVTKIIDAIFGTDWTSGLNSLQDSVLKWGKNENAITLDRDITVQDIAGKFGYDLPDRIAYGDAYSAGAEVGRGIENSIEQFGTNLKNKVAQFGNLGEMTNLGGLPNMSDPSLALNNAYDPSGANDDIAKGLDELNGTTGDINDKMDIADDDFEYLRKIAEMEWRNEFTTAEIQVNMTNNNAINSDRDLDGIVEYLSDALKTEMTIVANGVHY